MEWEFDLEELAELDSEFEMSMEEPKQKMRKLNDSTSSILRRGQLITKLSDIVKELIDNSVDARCTRVQVLLENYGLKQIEVRDNGHGIPHNKLRQIVSGGYTSKLQSDAPLSCDQQYGFRGEALSSICSFSKLSILTKTSEDPYGIRFEFDNNGIVISESPGAISKGTHVRVSDLFSKYPVRRNLIQEKNRSCNELKEIESYLKSQSLANPTIHFSLMHNGHTVWSKPAVASLDQAIIHVFGIFVAKSMVKHGPVTFQIEGEKLNGFSTIEMHIPRTPIDPKLMTQSTNKMTTIFVNRKRVQIREFEKLLQVYVEAAVVGDTNSKASKFPIAVLKIQVPVDQVDFNREVDKSKVFLMFKDEIADKLEEMLYEYYKVDVNHRKGMMPIRSIALRNISPLKNMVPVTDIDIDVSDRCSSLALPPSAPQNRTDNVLSFLQDLPIISNSNFSRSPAKTPTFGTPVITNAVSGAEPIQAHLAEPAVGCCVPEHAGGSNHGSNGSKTTLVSKFNIDLDLEATQIWHSNPTSQEQMSRAPATSAFSTNEWIHGRLKDHHGNSVESTIVMSRGVTMTPKSYKKRPQPTNPFKTVRPGGLPPPGNPLSFTPARVPDCRTEENTIECFPPRVPLAVQIYLDKQNLQQREVFQLQESINSKEIVVGRRSFPHSENHAPLNGNGAKVQVIGILPGSPQFIVKIDSMLGVFCPSNLLEMEPYFKTKVKIPCGNSVFSTEDVTVLLQEFTTLSCDNYSEDMAKRVFHLLKDLDETENFGNFNSM